MKDETKEQFRPVAEKLRAYRNALGISQEAMSNALFSYHGTVSRIENCDHEPGYTKVLQILRYMQLSLAEFEDAEVLSTPRGSVPFLACGKEPLDVHDRYVPFYPMHAACGLFSDSEETSPTGWICCVNPLDRNREDLFCIRACGHSMEPTIQDGDICLFRIISAGSREGKIVLAQHHCITDPDTNGSFTIKEYHSEKVMDKETETWLHTRIVLKPRNRSYEPIVIPPDEVGDFRIIAEFVRVLNR